MFEPQQSTEPASSKGLWISVSIIVVLAVAGALFYMTSRSSEKGPATVAGPVAATPKGNADPVHDLKILRATMDKDRTGTTAIWLVAIQNKSTAYTYSDIQYETSYFGADNKPLLVNQGKIPISIGPGEQKNPELRDALYPTGTAWFKFRITGATSAAQ
jgi:hypothetical protein